MAFNLADVFETVADSVPDTIALTYEGVDHSYRQLEVESNKVAHMLTAAGISAGDHVSLFLKNSVEHVNTILGVIKIRAVPININYRYTPAELLYIFENSDSVAIVVEESEHQDNLAQVVGQIPTLRTIFVIGDIAESLSLAAADAGVTVQIFDPSGQTDARDFAPRTGDELWVLYTGGTTGYPKGVVWRHDDFFHKPLSGGNPYDENPRKDLTEVGAAAKEFPALSFLIAAPLMHGAALYSLFTFLTLGARLVLMRGFDSEKVVRSIESDKVNVVLIVGDGMGSPLADAMEELKDEVDLSTLFSVTSGGAIWSVGVRERMLAIKPELVLRDNFGASETGNDGAFEVREDGTLAMAPTSKMTVLDERLQEVAPGSESVGMIARIGRVPLGYYRDEEKSARTFPTLPDGTRVAVLGDMGVIESDGTIVFLGRGSQCINTGGEKVYAEEVEACLHAHPAVADALVVPSPDERMGQKVSAVVAVRPGVAEPSLDEIQAHCRTMLAGYKIPRLLVVVDEIKRTPAGKADYKWAKQAAVDAIGAPL